MPEYKRKYVISSVIVLPQTFSKSYGLSEQLNWSFLPPQPLSLRVRRAGNLDGQMLEKKANQSYNPLTIASNSHPGTLNNLSKHRHSITQLQA